MCKISIRPGTFSNCNIYSLGYAALRQNRLGNRSMSALLGLFAVIYGLSLAIAAGGGVLMTVSPGFRRSLIGDAPTL